MKAAVNWEVARRQRCFEELDELGLVEGPDRLTRLVEVDLVLDGVVEAEEVRAVLARAMTRDGGSIGMTFAFAKMNCDAPGGPVERDVAVPSH